MFSTTSAADIPGRIDGDLYFNDNVFVSSGATYGSDGSVDFEGEGSLTIGQRLGNGFPRVVFYGGTNFSIAQDYGDDGVPERDTWKGVIEAPNTNMSIPFTHVAWVDGVNHATEEGELNVSKTFGFESFHETYNFSPAAYVVLPLDIPDGARVWYAFHDIDPENPGTVTEDSDEGKALIAEDDYCIVENGLCVLEIESMNQVLFLEESFEKCPRSSVPNGDPGKIPYCAVTCNKGYALDEKGFACYKINSDDEESSKGGEEEEKVIDTEHLTKSTTSEKMTENLKGARYRGAGLKLGMIDTTDLKGKDLRNALRRNAALENRMGGKDKKAEEPQEDSSLAKIIKDIQSKLWSWENQKTEKTTIIASTEGGEEIQLAEGEMKAEGESEAHNAMHASAPLLPSTGSSVLFIIISILGISLMMLAFKR